MSQAYDHRSDPMQLQSGVLGCYRELFSTRRSRNRRYQTPRTYRTSAGPMECAFTIFPRVRGESRPLCWVRSVCRAQKCNITLHRLRGEHTPRSVASLVLPGRLTRTTDTAWLGMSRETNRTLIKPPIRGRSLRGKPQSTSIFFWKAYLPIEYTLHGRRPS
jgi:hypothetical protein